MHAAESSGESVADLQLTFPYDASFFERIDAIIEPLIYHLMIVNVILCVVAFRYRQVASIFLLCSCVHLMVVSAIPSEHNQQHARLIYLDLLFIVAAQSCHAGSSIGCATFAFFIIEFVLKHLVDGDRDRKYLIFIRLFYLFGVLLLSTLI